MGPALYAQPWQINGGTWAKRKPIATSLETARKIVETARAGGIVLGVASQHRFDDSTTFVKKAIADGRLGKILEADAYVKWWRSDEYYSRPI